jgi:hypothetical protein
MVTIGGAATLTAIKVPTVTSTIGFFLTKLTAIKV